MYRWRSAASGSEMPTRVMFGCCGRSWRKPPTGPWTSPTIATRMGGVCAGTLRAGRSVRARSRRIEIIPELREGFYRLEAQRLKARLSEIPFAVFVDVNRHGFCHQISIEAHFEVDVTVLRISAIGRLGIGSDAVVVDDLLAVEPYLDVSAGVRDEARLHAEVVPLAAELASLFVERDGLAAKVLGDAEDAPDIAERKHRAVVIAEMSGFGAVLLPVRDDQANRHDWEVRREVLAEAVLLRTADMRDEGARLHKFVALAVRTVRVTGFKLIVWAHGDRNRLVTSADDLRFHADRAELKP